MKKTNTFVIIITASLAFLLGGCSVDSPTPPPSSPPGGATPTTVQVSLSAAAIANGGTSVVTAVVTNASSVVMQNVSVTFSVISAGAGSFTPSSAVTDASGVATSQFTAVTPNTTATIRASVTVGTTTISGSAPITIGTPPVIATSVVVALSSSTLPAAGGAVTVNATVTGAGSAPVSGALVSFTVSDNTAGSFSAASATTNASGVASVTFTAIAQATGVMVQISATTGTLSNSATLTIGSPPAPAAETMSLSVSPAQIAIQAQSIISVTLLSSSGAPVFSTPVTISISGNGTLGSLSSSATVTSVAATTNASGIASATFYAGTSAGIVTVTATDGTRTRTASIVITSDPAFISLAIGDPSTPADDTLLNGENVAITANVLNLANQFVSVGTTVSFTMVFNGSNAPGALSSTTAFTDQFGNASITFTADDQVTGPVFITATAGAVSTPIAVIQVNPAQAGSILYVSSEPTVIGIADSGSPSDSLITFQVLNSVSAPMVNQGVTFSIAIGPADATLGSSGGTTASGVTNQNGEVTVILHAGYISGSVRVVATTVSGSTTLSTSAGAVTITGGVPADDRLSISASRLNIDGIGCDGVETTINAALADRSGNFNILVGTTVYFSAESGLVVNGSNVTDDTGRTSVIAYSSGIRPADGRATILVQTTGEEAFIDSNGNGVYDSLEDFTDLKEPFRDDNDSNGHDAGEQFWNWPSTVPGATLNNYDNVNGVWDARIPIFRQFRIIISGAPSFSTITTATTGTAAVSIPNGGSENFLVCLLDVNGNPPKGGTTVSIKTTKGTVTPTSATVLDTNVSGPYCTSVQLISDTCTSSCVQENVSLTADISWNGTCGGAVTIPIQYPSAIVFTHL